MKKIITRNISRKFKLQYAVTALILIQAFYLKAEVKPADDVKNDRLPVKEVKASFDDFDFNIYPNPYKEGAINLEITNSVEAALEIKLYNTIGKIVLTKDIQSGSDFSHFKIDPEQKLAPGLYFLSVSMQGENFSKTKKLIVSE
ncbi:T9SS type A sorting domain-containing protein [Chondrinema litorale]|uniref:T9SS type A sorting domain-containing protein n=1 Tax=Chondrinema litorale TaxID=2994555 RepID=UPI002543672E|nr:T9SS type A sorting domain-containing protein [Chondrinema litorale]UZR92657.1 T9SS type A sorting domain-containing protein [Chondrinema litorale]